MVSEVDVSVLLILCTAQETIQIQIHLPLCHHHRRRLIYIRAAGQFYISVSQRRPLLFNWAHCSFTWLHFNVLIWFRVFSNFTAKMSLT